MSDAISRAALVARLNTVPDIGVVSGYRRAIVTWADFRAAFAATIGGVEQLRGWSVAWESGDLQPDAWQADGRLRMAGTQTYVARGYLGLSDADATDLTFAALVGAARDALATFGTVLPEPQSHVPVFLRQNTFIELDIPGKGRGLCHYCELAITFRDTVIL